MILSTVAMVGVAALSFYNDKTISFKQLTSSTFSTVANRAQESFVMENVAYHSGTQSFNITMTNTGYIPINVTNIQVQGPTTNQQISTNDCIIMPGQTCTSGIVYHCFSDPVKITATTSRGTTLTRTTTPVVPWYNSQWQFRKEITIDYTKVGSTLTNFPVLVNITDTDLKNNALISGNDILFTGCNGITKLNHEIDNYTSSTGTLTAWVQVPTLYNTPNNIIYMYYGNSGSFSQQNIDGTWDSNYGGVWHFNTRNGGSSIVLDNVKTTSAITSDCALSLSNFRVGSGTNQLLLVAVSFDGGLVSSVKYGGAPLTQAKATANTMDAEFWYLKGAPSRTANIVVTFRNGGGDECRDEFAGIGAYSFFGVDQTNPLPRSASSTGSAGPTSVDITNQYAYSWVIDNTAILDNGQLTSPSQTLVWNNMTCTGPCSGGTGSSASSKAIPSLANTPLIFSWNGGADKWAAVAIEIKSIQGITTVPDSTSNANDLTTFNISSSDQIPGPFAKALNFDGATKYLSRTSGLNGMPSNANSPQTGSAWFRVSSNPNSARDIFTLQPSVGNSAVKMGFRSSNFAISNWSGGTLASTTTPSAGTWHYAVYTYDGTTNMLYIDGTQVATSTTLPDSGSVNSFYVGTYSSLSEYFNGYLDEIRYSKIARSASWISTEYNNEATPSIFYTIGPQQSVTYPRTSN
jgi:hypothetical protein